jgi:hypothetical protein
VVYSLTMWLLLLSQLTHPIVRCPLADRLISKLSTLSQLVCLFLISLGWKVTRNNLTPREIRLLLIAFGLYACFSATQAACASSNSNKLCEAYLLTEYVLHSLLLLGESGTHPSWKRRSCVNGLSSDRSFEPLL